MEIFALIVWFFCGLGAAMIAQSKGRSGCGWFIAGVLFGPLALIVVGFMAPAPGTPVIEFWPNETVLYSEGKVHVTNQRLLVGDRSFAIKNLQAVTWIYAGADRGEIKLNNLSGKTIYVLESDNSKQTQRIVKAINDGIVAPVGTSTINSTTNAQSIGSAKSSSEILAELKNRLEAELITQDNQEQIQRIAKAINDGIAAPVSTSTVNSTTNTQSSGSAKSSSEILA